MNVKQLRFWIGGLVTALAFYGQSAEYSLCVLVDGSQKMVIEKSYDAVLSALETKILDTHQRLSADEWGVEVIAVGVTKQWLRNKRYFSSLSLYPSPPGAGLDINKSKNRIPNITDESPLTYAELKTEFHKLVAEKATLNTGVIIISDNPDVNIFSNNKKYHQNILVQLAKTSGSVVAIPNRIKISNDVKAAFDGFFAYVEEQKKQPVVSLECLDKAPIYAGMPVRFKLKGTDLGYALVNYGAGTPVLKIEQAEIDRIVEYTYSSKGSFKVELRGVRGSKETAAEVEVVVAERPPYPVVKITVAELKNYVGDPVKFYVDLANATGAVIDFGDKSALGKIDPARSAQGVEHVYVKPGAFKVVVSAQGAGGEVKKEMPLTVDSLPSIDLDLESSGKSDGKVVVTPKAELATEIKIDFGDGTAHPAFHGQPLTHTYTKDGAYSIKMAATRQGKDEVVAKVFVAKLPVEPPPPITEPSTKVVTIENPTPTTPKADFILETNGAGELIKNSDGGYTVKRAEVIDFVNKSKNAQKFRWVFGGSAEPMAERSVSYAYGQDGVYEVTLTVYGENNQSDVRKVLITVIGGKSPILWVLFFLAVVVGLGWVVLRLRRPELSAVVSINGQDGNAKSFTLLGHRALLSELSVPLECRAKKVDGIWMVSFRALEECVLEKRPSLTPIRLEAKTWTQSLNTGEFVMAGKPHEVLKVQEI